MIGCSAATGIPLTEINKTHTALTSVPELDAFQITTTTPAAATVSSGGTGVQCTKNLSMDVMQPVIQLMGTTTNSDYRKITIYHRYKCKWSSKFFY